MKVPNHQHKKFHHKSCINVKPYLICKLCGLVSSNTFCSMAPMACHEDVFIIDHRLPQWWETFRLQYYQHLHILIWSYLSSLLHSLSNNPFYGVLIVHNSYRLLCFQTISLFYFNFLVHFLHYIVSRLIYNILFLSTFHVKSIYVKT